MANITNNYASGSCTFEAGSSQNGDVTIYQGATEPKKNVSGGSHSIGSPLHLSDKKGTKIDFIRIMNAWYECGKVVNTNGDKPTKKEFFVWLGKLFNIDLADYDKDLSNSMASSVALDKQTRIFEELKSKQEEIFNSK